MSEDGTWTDESDWESANSLILADDAPVGAATGGGGRGPAERRQVVAGQPDLGSARSGGSGRARGDP